MNRPAAVVALVACLLFCIFGALAFLALINAGEDFMCSHVTGQKPQYCEAGR